MQTRRVALVTGSARRRLGWHVADALADRGDAVVIHYHSSAAAAQATVAEFREQSRQAIALGANLADEQQVRSLVQQTIEQFGRIDVLVHCAAMWRKKPLAEATAADVRAEWEANTLSTFLCCQQAGLAMARQPEGGSIVTFADWAIERPYLDHAAYFSSKGAIPTLTRTFAVELAALNPRVRVNCILPGPVMLPPDLPQAERDEAIAGTLVKCEGRPSNVVQAVLHFIDNDFITGACLSVDGGRTIA